MVKVFYDTETTGVKHWRHSIHQLSGLIEVDDEVVDTFDYRLAPHPKALIDPAALAIAGVTEEEILAYPKADIAIAQFTKLLRKYIDPYDSKSKAYLVGYNSARFDGDFLRTAFDLVGNSYFMAYFFAEPIDVMVLAGQYLMGPRRLAMPSFKLKRVALELGIVLDESKLHDGVYDTQITRQIYRIVTGIDIEI